MTDPVKIIVGEGSITEVNVPEYNLIQTGGGGGSDGATFFPEVSEEGVISWTNDGGYDNPEPVNIKGPAGNDGNDGNDGEDGTTFTPAVDASGNLSWTNDGGKQNPQTVNIKGPTGNDGSDGEDGADGVSPTVTFSTITGGHTMTVTDKDHPEGQSINIMDGTSGGGGTSDYDDLTDKPSINNVTLSGNKTAADLGLGTYSKPSGGIPASDLASAVQTSLGKADSALQSVPSTYRTAAAQDAIDSTQDAEIESISRRNLLDNWFFVGGGSQLGYGTFPINQRGQTSYSTSGNGIDRWKASSSSMTYTVNSGGMLVKATAASQQWYQILSNQSELAGKQVTLSALTASNILIQTTVDIPSTIPSGTQTIGSGSSDVNGYALYVRTMGGKLAAVVYAGSSFSSSGIALIAVKLEIGSNQTLAHLEGMSWVLNDIPDYGDELEKCQRYLFPVTTDAFFVGTTGANHTNPTFFVPTPVTMAKNPTTQTSISVNAQYGSGYVNGVALNVSSCIATTDGVRITTTGSTAIGTVNYAMCLIQVVYNTMFLSAES